MVNPASISVRLWIFITLASTSTLSKWPAPKRTTPRKAHARNRAWIRVD